jgi:hypothetical protein
LASNDSAQRTPRVSPLDCNLLEQRIRGEYREMPGLRLTFRQAQRLWGLEPHDCARVLDSLVADGFLEQVTDGCYVRSGSRDVCSWRRRGTEVREFAESTKGVL